MNDLQMKYLRCGVAMGEGYLADGGHGVNSEVAKWVGGAPDVRWYRVRMKGHDLRISLRQLRLRRVPRNYYPRDLRRCA